MLKHFQIYELTDIFLMKKLKDFAFLYFKSQLHKLHADEELINCVQEMYKSVNHVNSRMKNAVVEIM